MVMLHVHKQELLFYKVRNFIQLFSHTKVVNSDSCFGAWSKWNVDWSA